MLDGMRRRTATALTAAAMLALSACSSSDDGGDIEDPAAESSTAVDAPTEAPPPVLPFGETHAFEDGLSISVQPIETVIPTEFGFEDTYLLLDTVFRNDGTVPLEITALWQDCIVDGAQMPYELLGERTTHAPDLIQAGREVTWRSACIVNDGTDLEVSMGIGDRERVYFTGTVPR